MAEIHIQKRPMGTQIHPAYLQLSWTGELQARAGRVAQLLQSCQVCPRNCRVNRLENHTAVCHSGRYAAVSSSFPHFGEENCLRGWKGSGTIFFSFCNLRCVFCQNYETSLLGQGHEVRPDELAAIMIDLQRRGCHNINLVTPEHVVPQILEALPIAVDHGLRLPIVYNTSGYDSLESLKLLDHVVDVYMPDFKFWDPTLSLKYIKAKDYPRVARRAIKEMHHQVGDLVLDEHGLAKRGLLVRHLVMPGGIAGTRQIMRFIARHISPRTYVNLMDQYFPPENATMSEHHEIGRRITQEEYEEAISVAREEGIERLDWRERGDHRW